MREGGFPAPCEPLDDGGFRKAAAYRLLASPADTIMVSPALAARQTAETAGLAAVLVDDLRDIDHGGWSGQNIATIHQSDAVRLGAWMSDPALGAPGGESLADVQARIAPWLEIQSARTGSILAITHPMVIRAVLATALDLPGAATLRIDIAPLAAVSLSFNGVWRLQAIVPD